jgi:hypothetical protein
MTIDERLEALTHSVELIAAMQLKTEERLEALSHSVELIAAMQLKTEKGLSRLSKYVRIIARNHERGFKLWKGRTKTRKERTKRTSRIERAGRPAGSQEIARREGDDVRDDGRGS